jgi:hypothetical protein
MLQVSKISNLCWHFYSLGRFCNVSVSWRIPKCDRSNSQEHSRWNIKWKSLLATGNISHLMCLQPNETLMIASHSSSINTKRITASQYSQSIVLCIVLGLGFQYSQDLIISDVQHATYRGRDCSWTWLFITQSNEPVHTLTATAKFCQIKPLLTILCV